MKETINGWFIKSANVNSKINDDKSYNILLLNRSLATAALFSFASFVCFYFGELDKKHQEIKVVNPIEVKGNFYEQPKAAASTASASDSPSEGRPKTGSTSEAEQSRRDVNYDKQATSPAASTAFNEIGEKQCRHSGSNSAKAACSPNAEEKK
jgi:hypothetical protein